MAHGHGLFSKTMIMFHKLYEHLPKPIKYNMYEEG